MLEKARRGRYTSDEVNADPSIPDWFVQQTFDNDAGGYTVKPEILQHISWGTADVLAPDLADQTGTADIVFCQNLIVNLPYRQSPRAFQNAVSVCADDGALFLDGVPLRLRERLTRAAGLEPLDYRIADIHSDVLRLHGESWPWHYWGVEPLQDGESRTQRYATIYFKTVA